MILALDDIADPSNLGAILRSALAFGFDDIFLSGNSVELHSPKVIRASAGSVFHLNVATDVDLVKEISELKVQDYLIIGTDTGGFGFQESLKKHHKLCLVIGNEAHGISPEVITLCDEIIRIAIADRCESLSAPVAAGIAMYEIFNRHLPDQGNR